MDMMKNRKGRVKILEANAQWFGVTYKEDKADAVKKINQLVEAGLYPAKLFK
jgi:hypothetical protein